jgi:hypothetical protein
MDWLLKAVLTATLVAALLLIVRLWGQRFAGLLTGLPTVTAPALVWLAFARGPDFAADAAAGCIVTSVSCALFGLGYALASVRARPLIALLAGSLLAALPLPALGHWRPQFGASMLLALAACLGCALMLRGLLATPPHRPRPDGARPPGRATQIVGTAVVSGAVSGVVGVCAGELGAFWSGALASAPLIAAVVAMRLHVDEGSVAVAPFMHGYLGGVAARSCFAAAFGLLVAPFGAVPALAGASVVLVLGLWFSITN